MRKFLFAASVVVLTACTSAKPEDVTTDSTTVVSTSDTVKVVVDSTVVDSTSK